MPFHVIETSDREGKKDVFSVSSHWIEEGILFWPPKMLMRNKSQKNIFKSKPDENWQEILTFKILQSDIESYETANARVKFYSRYTNTDSELEERKLLTLKRKHPITYTETHLDFSTEFEKLQQISKSTMPLSRTVVPEIKKPYGKHNLSLSSSCEGGTSMSSSSISSQINVHHVSETGLSTKTVAFDSEVNKRRLEDSQSSPQKITIKRRNQMLKQDKTRKIRLEELASPTSELKAINVNHTQSFSPTFHNSRNNVTNICETSPSSVVEELGIEIYKIKKPAIVCGGSTVTPCNDQIKKDLPTDKNSQRTSVTSSTIPSNKESKTNFRHSSSYSWSSNSLSKTYESNNESEATSNKENIKTTSDAIKRKKVHRVEKPINGHGHGLVVKSSKNKKDEEKCLSTEKEAKEKQSASCSTSSKAIVGYASSHSGHTCNTDIDKSSSEDETFIENEICSTAPEYVRDKDVNIIEEQVEVHSRYVAKSSKSQNDDENSTKEVHEFSNHSRAESCDRIEESVNPHGYSSVKSSKNKKGVEKHLSTRKKAQGNHSTSSTTSSSPSNAIVRYMSTHSNHANNTDTDRSSSEIETFIDNEKCSTPPKNLIHKDVNRMEEKAEVRSRYLAKSSKTQNDVENLIKPNFEELFNHSRERSHHRSVNEIFSEEEQQSTKGRMSRKEHISELSSRSLPPPPQILNTYDDRSDSEISSDEEQQSTSTTRKMGQENNKEKVCLSTIRRDRRAIKNVTKIVKTVLSQQNDFGNRLASMEHGLKTLTEMFSSYVVRQNKRSKISLVPLDPSFVMPRPKLTKIKEILILNTNCLAESYIDQMVIRLKRLVSTKEKTFNKSVKDVMEYLFSYELICHYSWTGKQELNSNATPKQKFQCLYGVIELIIKVCSFHLIYTKSIGKDITSSLKNFIRRARQNMIRQNQE